MPNHPFFCPPSKTHSVIRVHGLVSVILYENEQTAYMGAGISAFPVYRTAKDEAKQLGLRDEDVMSFVADRVFHGMVREFGDGVSVERVG